MFITYFSGQPWLFVYFVRTHSYSRKSMTVQKCSFPESVDLVDFWAVPVFWGKSQLIIMSPQGFADSDKLHNFPTTWIQLNWLDWRKDIEDFGRVLLYRVMIICLSFLGEMQRIKSKNLTIITLWKYARIWYFSFGRSCPHYGEA